MSNTNQKSFFTNLLSNPTSFSILVLSAVIVIVWLDQRGSSDNQTPTVPSSVAGNTNQATSGGAQPFQLNPPSLTGSDTPKILNTMGGGDAAGAPGKLQAPDLGGLLAGLESKVKADPTDIGKRLLLAQTYNELGMADKALVELRDMNKASPDHGRVNLVLASILSSSEQATDIKESLSLLEKLKADNSVKQYLVSLYKGNALIRSQDHDGALSSWKEALKSMPEADNRRATLEQQIADLENKESTPVKQAQDKKG